MFAHHEALIDTHLADVPSHSTTTTSTTLPNAEEAAAFAGDGQSSMDTWTIF